MSDQEMIDELLTAADPLSKMADLPGPDSAVAFGVLQRAKADARRAPSKTRIAIAAAVAGCLGVTGAAVAFGSGDGRAASSDHVICNGSSQSDLQVHFDPRTDDPVRRCREEWEAEFGAPAPDLLTACVDSSVQGSIHVYPGPPDVCAEHDAVIYTGPTEEQRRIAAFMQEALALGDAQPPDTCISFEETKAILDRLLAKHGLVGWTYGGSVGNVGPCARVEGIIEYRKMIVVNRGPRR